MRRSLRGPTFSIIVPVRDEETYLDEMIRSVTAQSVSSWELVFVDDGSTDSTPRILQNWADRDERILIASVGERLGKVAAFNLAFEASRGDYVLHIGGDDRLISGSLNKRLQAFSDAPPSTLVLGKLQIIDSAGRSRGRPIPRGSRGSQSSPGATYSRELCSEIFPIPTHLPSEDIWLGNAAVARAQQITHLKSPVVEYRIHGGNSNPRARSFEQMNGSIGSRTRAVEALLRQTRFDLGPPARRELEVRWEAERLRRSGATWRLLTKRDLRVVDRLALASMSNRSLWALRQRLGIVASGWRGR